MARRAWGEGSYDYNEQEDAWRWRGYYTDRLTGEHKRKEIQSKTRKVLKTKVAEWLAEQTDGAAGRIKVSEWCRIWIEQVMAQSVKERTIANYEITIRNHIAKKWGDKNIRDVTPLAIQEYLNSLNTDHSPSTVATIRTHIIACFNAAVDYGYLQRNPAKQTRPPRQVKPDTTALTEEEVGRLLKVAADAAYLHEEQRAKNDDGSSYLRKCYYMILLMAVTTGMRQGEIFALKRSRIALNERKVHCAYSLSDTRKNGLKIETTKTKTSNRQILLPDKTVKALGKWLRYQEEYSKKYAGIYENELDLAFTNSYGKPISASNFMGRFYRKAVKAAGLGDNVTFHTLRHTHATQLLHAGVNVKVVSERLGHSAVSVTMDVYAHCLPDMQEVAVNELDKIYN